MYSRILISLCCFLMVGGFSGANSLFLYAQFSDIGSVLEGAGDAALAWADYDRDGDLDVLIAGRSASGPRTTLYEQSNGSFSAASYQSFPDLALGDVAWGDYDGDGDADLLLTGEQENGTATTRLFRNNGNRTFTDTNANIANMRASNVDWGDYDSDGDLDFYIAGVLQNGTSTTKLYRNNGGRFSEVYAGLKGLRRGDGQWSDYDRDGDLDLLLTGRDTQNKRWTILYKNDNGSFVEVDVLFPDVDLSAIDWGDFDNDGYDEVAITGTSDKGLVAQVYENPHQANGTDVLYAFEGVEFSDVQWGEFTGDDRVDLVVMGRNASGVNRTIIYERWGAAFRGYDVQLKGLFKGALEGVDYDGDGDLDLSIVGYTAGESPLVHLYQRQGGQQPPANTPPLPPYNLWVEDAGTNTILNWEFGNDKETTFYELTYEVRLGTFPGGSDILAGERVSDRGSSAQFTKIVSYLPQDTYYWSVRSIDEQGKRSAYATEQVFEIKDDGFDDVHANLRATGDRVEWNDFDADGDLDVFLIGRQGFRTGPAATEVFKNEKGSFSEFETDLPDVRKGRIQFSDIDNDNDLDLLLLDLDVSNGGRIFRNEYGRYTQVPLDIPRTGCSSFGNSLLSDIDNNGFADLITSPLYLNNTMYNIGVRLNRRGHFDDSYISWGTFGTGSVLVPGDYNSDGQIDYYTAGLDNSACKAPQSYLLKNQGESLLFDINQVFRGGSGEPAWGDYDADGDLDLITAGSITGGLGPFSASFSGVYRNDGGDTFTLVSEILAAGDGYPDWGDYDIDGDLDLLIPGLEGSPLYENRNGIFVNIVGAFDGIESDFAEWGDYDGDGDLDVLISGVHDGVPVTRIYANSQRAENDEPHAPNQLTASSTGSSITFRWSSGRDEETPAEGLSYTLRVGTKPGASDIFSPTALANGTPLTPELGNVFQNTSWTLNDLQDGTYYWSVQSIDGGYRGSRFAREQRFTKKETPPPSPGFVDSGIAFTGVELGAAEWADADNDGDLDLLVAGDTGSGPLTQLYENTGGTMVKKGHAFVDVDRAAIDWGDYDNDGDQDVIIIGRGHNQSFNTRLYRNTGSSFQSISTGIPGLFSGDVKWGDYDNDGDLDLLLTGVRSSYQNMAAVYRNDGGSFTDIGATLTGTSWGQAAWVDFDDDGDLDIMLTGRIDKTITRRTYLYKNHHGTFTEVYDGLPDVDLSSVDWGDFDDDGDLDLLIAGTTGGQFITRIYRNAHGNFTDIGAGFPGAEFASARWGDMDGDGDLDVLLSGATNKGRITDVYINDNGQFTPAHAGMTAVSKSAVSWADYDKDGDLDAFVTGQVSASRRVAALYVNTNRTFQKPHVAAPVGNPIHTDRLGDGLQSALPESVNVLANYPNPFNPSTSIRFEVPEATHVFLAVYDVSGRQVAVLADGFREAGRYEVRFDGSQLASGVYLTRLETSVRTVMSRMLLLK